MSGPIRDNQVITMYPCAACYRHLREADRTCPFCGVVQSTVTSPMIEGLGAFSLTMLLFGATACSNDTVSATTTSESGGTSTTTTTESDSTDTGQASTFADSETGDTANDSMSASISFYAGPDPTLDIPADCDPFAQDCLEGEKCVPYGSTGGNWDANKCVPIQGDGQPGDPCIYGGTAEATDDCGAESHCWDVMDVDGMAVGTCTEFCQGTPDDPICPMGTDCLIANDGSISLCISSCDPLLQDCSPGLACFWADNGFNCIFTTQDIPVGEPCEFINDCVAGLTCMAAELVPNCAGAECCASYCSLAAPVCPQMGTECTAFFDPNTGPPGYDDIGVCVVPGA